MWRCVIKSVISYDGSTDKTCQQFDANLQNEAGGNEKIPTPEPSINQKWLNLDCSE